MKEKLINFSKTHLWQKSSLIGILGILFIIWQHELLLAILDKHIRSAEFEGIILGWFSSFMLWLIGKKG